MCCLRAPQKFEKWSFSLVGGLGKVLLVCINEPRLMSAHTLCKLKPQTVLLYMHVLKSQPGVWASSEAARASSAPCGGWNLLDAAAVLDLCEDYTSICTVPQGTETKTGNQPKGHTSCWSVTLALGCHRSWRGFTPGRGRSPEWGSPVWGHLTDSYITGPWSPGRCCCYLLSFHAASLSQACPQQIPKRSANSENIYANICKTNLSVNRSSMYRSASFDEGSTAMN